MQDWTADDVCEALRKVRYPGLSRDIVSFGFVRDVTVDGAAVTVRFAPDTTDAAKVAEMEDAIRDVLYSEAFALVQVRTEAAFDDDVMLLGRGTMNPLQAELLEEGIEPQPDLLANGSNGSPSGASGLPGFGEWQPPDPFEGPSAGPDPSYRGALPVFQWEVNPDDEGAPTAEEVVLDGDWEFNVWWQALPARGLVYASLQATRPDVETREEARGHPVGRNDAVNLVYDERRRGVVAVYGTVRDFRPFVDAFRRAYEPADEAARAHAGSGDAAAVAEKGA